MNPLMHPSPPWSQDRYLAAWYFAALAHGKQTLPGSELPYLAHLAAVAMEVMSACVVEPDVDANLALQCALLHDTLEDTATDAASVEAEFGAAVRAGVDSLSKNPSLPKAAAMQDSLNRIRQQPRAIWLVKLADRIVNLGPPPPYWTEEKIAHYRQEARDILAALGEASPVLARRLAQRIDNYPLNSA